MFDNEFDLFLAENAEVIEENVDLGEKMTINCLLGEAVLDDMLLEGVMNALNKAGNKVMSVCMKLAFGGGCKKIYATMEKNLEKLITNLKVKKVEDIDFYEDDRIKSIKALKEHLKKLQDASKYTERPDDKEVRKFYNYVQRDKELLTELPKYISWLETDYKRIIAERKRRFLAENK